MKGSVIHVRARNKKQKLIELTFLNTLIEKVFEKGKISILKIENVDQCAENFVRQELPPLFSNWDRYINEIINSKHFWKYFVQ